MISPGVRISSVDDKIEFDDILLEDVIFEETFEDIDLNELFHYAHLLKYYKPDLKIIYSTCRMKYPVEDLSPEFAFREIPFNKVFATDFHKLIYERI